MLRYLLQGLRAPLTEAPPVVDAELAALAANLDRVAQKRLGRSLAIRQVDAGSCNGCELEIHALNNAFHDLERFGLRFVASPPARRCAACDWTRYEKHAGSLGADLARHPGPAMGGGGWRLRADHARLSLEESIYLGGAAPRRTEQVVLHGLADGPQHVKWGIGKVG